MRVQTVRDLGALVRSARRDLGMTQADLAERLRVSRDWVVRLEQGSPRVEAQKMLDALTVLGLLVDVAEGGQKPAAKKASARPRTASTGRFVSKAPAAKAAAPKVTTSRKTDPFAFLHDRTS